MGGRSWPKEKMQSSACVRAAERVAEAETSDHVHLRKQETVSQWGPGGSVCREGCSSLSKLSQTAVEKRGCHRNNMAPRRGIPGRALGSGERLSSKGTLGRVWCFIRPTINHRLLLASAAATAKQQRTVASGRPRLNDEAHALDSGYCVFQRLSVPTSVQLRS